MPNALATQDSLYLRQHAHNPVPWQPWSEEVFERAQCDDKLVFISIGYSSCHWCHVMERESFEDEEVAAILDRWYIPVKIDREERPDVDAVYMGVCQAVTGHGGWPLTVITTPDKDVVFIGTYFPKQSTQYRIGLIDILERVAQLWQTDRERLVLGGREAMYYVTKHLCSADRGRITDDICHHAADVFARAYDHEFGGFGNQPKFPMASALWFLSSWGIIGHDVRVRDMVARTLEAMRWGGIWDHVGGGFHRYSTDRRWFLPHFEKMLYDQALLLLVYSDVAVLDQNELFRRTAAEIAQFMDRELLLPCGAYAASLDADTVEGEGVFYQWRYDELAAMLPPNDMERLVSVFSLQHDGNAHDEATGTATGLNILYAGTRTAELLKQFGGTLDDFFAWWEPIRQQLSSARSIRCLPARDDKILCDWNALAIGALARSGRLFGDELLIARAQRAWEYIVAVHQLPTRLLSHCSYDGKPIDLATLDDQAFAAWALFELYQATARTEYFDRACELMTLIEQHFVTDDGILVNSSTSHVARVTEAADGATVSPVGMTAWVAAALSFFGDGQHYRQRAEQILDRYGGTVAANPASYTTLLSSYLLAQHGRALTLSVCVRDRQRVCQLLRRLYDPITLVSVETSPEDIPPRATMCTATECSPPAEGWDSIEQMLSNAVRLHNL
ncbi:MAG: thioredoxin domain-containing protein [Chlorobi bacterium]|nr:thioredoxin domain-containing protein [Chlorobiota bacterium]